MELSIFSLLFDRVLYQIAGPRHRHSDRGTGVAPVQKKKRSALKPQIRGRDIPLRYADMSALVFQ